MCVVWCVQEREIQDMTFNHIPPVLRHTLKTYLHKGLMTTVTFLDQVERKLRRHTWAVFTLLSLSHSFNGRSEIVNLRCVLACRSIAGGVFRRPFFGCLPLPRFLNLFLYRASTLAHFLGG